MIPLPFLPTAHPAFPIASLPEIPSHWQDASSWHDECPSFLVECLNNGNDAIVVYFSYPEDIESGACRFSVQRMGADPWFTVLYDGNDWSIAAATAEAASGLMRCHTVNDFSGVAEYARTLAKLEELIECPPVAHDGTPMSIEEALISDGIDAEADRSRA